MINVDKIHKSFGKVHAVRGVSFDAPDGKITGLLGPNGAGKSTTLRILYTVLRPDGGSATIDGVDVVTDSLGARGHIGALPHGAGLYPHLTARENIEYICLESWTLPFEDDSFDLTVLLQVIEHIALDKLDIFLREIRRVTRAEGRVIVSTPNRLIRLLPLQKPWNRFHVKEYSASDLEQLLSRYFKEVRVEGLFGTEEINAIERKRVRQKPLKVYLKEPLRKYLVRPLRGLLTGEPQTTSKKSRRVKSTGDNSVLPQSNTAATEAVDYTYTTPDLRFGDDSLHESLDLRATVTRVK